MFISLGWLELGFVIAVILLILAPGRLPGLTKNLSKAIQNIWDSFTG